MNSKLKNSHFRDFISSESFVNIISNIIDSLPKMTILSQSSMISLLLLQQDPFQFKNQNIVNFLTQRAREEKTSSKVPKASADESKQPADHCTSSTKWLV